jgi:cytochrome o ubiquinol oxidase subunit 3
MDALTESGGRVPPLWHYGHHDHDVIATKTFGFWLYMLSDALIFAALFAAYAVLDQPMNMAGGPTAAQIVHPVAAFWQTMAVMTSVFAYSLATVALKTGNKAGVLLGMAVALVLGLAFIGLELNDLARLMEAGATPDRSGFLSAFFILIASHGLHMIFGLLWMAVVMIQCLRSGFTQDIVARLLNLRMFWQFQASVWVCVYVFVYLRGAA